MREKIQKQLQKFVPEKITVEITPSEKEKLGHYSTNVAFRLAQIRQGKPFQIARELITQLEKNAPKNFFQKIEVAGPGFINFWLAPAVWQEELKEILKKKINYGRIKPAKKQKIQVEFVSANPTGPLTLANGRGGFLGDVLTNVLSWQGHEVEREYYVNDTGNQVLTLGKSLAAVLGLIPEEEKFYKGGYIEVWAKKNSAFIRKKLDSPLKIGQKAADEFLAKIREVLEKKAGIKFSRYTSEEKNIHRKGYIDKVLEIFKTKKLVYEKEKAIWLKTTQFGDDKDRVLITGAGEPTYFLADAGHYFETLERGFQTKINILGPDHFGYVTRINAAARIIGLKKSIVLITQAIRLVKNGKEFKMSKRKGDFITFEALIREVGSDAARFFFLMHAPESHMDFDLSLAKERSVKNPVYYTQYAYVRAKNIIRKVKIKPTNKNLEYLKTPQDIALLRELARFPETVNDSANDLRVHRLTKYALELAGTFHNFYEKERILGESNENLADARLSLVWGTEIILKNLLALLGVSRPSKM